MPSRVYSKGQGIKEINGTFYVEVPIDENMDVIKRSIICINNKV